MSIPSISDIINGVIGPDKITKDDVSKSQKNETGNTNTNTTTDQTTQSTSQTGSVTAGTTSQHQTASSTTQNLSNDQIATLNSMLDKFGNNFNLADLDALQSRILGAGDTLITGAKASLDRALGGDAALAGTINPILDQARQQAQQDIANVVAGSSTAAGSKFNTLVAAAGAKQADMSNLDFAALGAKLVQSNRAQVSADITQALSNLTSAVGTFAQAGVASPLAEAQINQGNSAAAANIGNILKGAVSSTNSVSDILGTSRQETQSTTNTIANQHTVSDELKNINLNTTTDTIGSTKQTDNADLLDLLKSL